MPRRRKYATEAVATPHGGEGGFGAGAQDKPPNHTYNASANFSAPPHPPGVTGGNFQSGPLPYTNPVSTFRNPALTFGTQAHRPAMGAHTAAALQRMGTNTAQLLGGIRAARTARAGNGGGRLIVPGFNLPPQRRYQLAAMRLVAQSRRAKDHLPSFVDMVMREETTRAQVACTPHQRVLLQFVWDHPLCVLRMPVGTSKTWCMTALTMFLLGRDPTERGVILSATQGQAEKPLGMVAAYLKDPDLAVPLRLVFPALQPTPRSNEKWTQTAITVARPPGIRDPSLRAIGLHGALPGARLSWIVVDDLLSDTNTATPAARDDVFNYFMNTVLARLDRDGDARCVVTNTPWHPKDLTYRLEKAGWPTLTMDVTGGLHIANAPDWDTDAIRPSRRPGEWYRLAAHDTPVFDDTEAVPLWPERYSADTIERIRAQYADAPHQFNQLYMSLCRDNDTARCKKEWIEACRDTASRLVAQYSGSNPTVTGVDLGVGLDSKKNDKTVFFTLELLPNGKRRVLDIDGGHWDGPAIVQKLIEKHRAYNSIVRVENNAAQDFLLQFAREMDAGVPIKPHCTGRNKAHPEFGVEAIFAQLQGKGWIIPSYPDGTAHKQVTAWIDDCLYYEPGKHTGDYLMASWFANEQARQLGFGSANRRDRAALPSSFAMGLMSR